MIAPLIYPKDLDMEITKLTQVENMIIASPHLDEKKMDAVIKNAVADVAWYIRNRKWEIHMAIYKHLAIGEAQGRADLANIMLDVVKVKHPKLQKARSTLRLYLSQEMPSATTLSRMKKLQGSNQDEGRDSIEAQCPILATKYMKVVPKSSAGHFPS